MKKNHINHLQKLNNLDLQDFFKNISIQLTKVSLSELESG